MWCRRRSAPDADALRRRLAAPAAAAVTCLTLAVACRATAVPARAGRAAVRPGLRPLPAEWWFSAWDIQSRVWPLASGAGVTVALLDSGVQANLPDLRGAVVPGGDTTGAGTNGLTDDDTPDDGHGTAMAAVIAGQGVPGGLVGIAPAAKIMPIRVGLAGRVRYAAFSDGSLAAGIRLAVGRGAQVINMSLAGPAPGPDRCDPAIQDAVAYAVEHDVVVVAGAGNVLPLLGEQTNEPKQPASCAGVLAVSAVNPNLTWWRHSERQPYVAVSAPGNEIQTLGRDGRNFIDGYGTSFASAFVAGEAALVRSRYPSMPWYRVVQRIINTALPKGAVPDDRFGYGIVRIHEAADVAHDPVPASAPNPVYQAFRSWLTTPPGQRFASPSPRPARSVQAAAPASPGGPPALAAALAAAVVVAAGGAALLVSARRRRRRPAGSTPDGRTSAPGPGGA
jgi:type VII secretion-associated serine protease mycosin